MNFRNTIFNYGNDGWYRSYFSFPISYRSQYFLNLSNISGIGGEYQYGYDKLFIEYNRMVFRSGNDSSAEQSVTVGYNIQIYSVGY